MPLMKSLSLPRPHIGNRHSLPSKALHFLSPYLHFSVFRQSIVNSMEEELRQVRQMECVSYADFNNGLFHLGLGDLGKHQVVCCDRICILDESITLHPGSLEYIVDQVLFPCTALSCCVVG